MPKDDQFAVYWTRELLRKGMTLAQAMTMVEEASDLHRVKEALERGCPPDLAYQIFGLAESPNEERDYAQN